MCVSVCVSARGWGGGGGGTAAFSVLRGTKKKKNHEEGLSLSAKLSTEVTVVPKAVLLRKSQCHQKPPVIGSVSHKATKPPCVLVAATPSDMLQLTFQHSEVFDHFSWLALI